MLKVLFALISIIIAGSTPPAMACASDLLPLTAAEIERTGLKPAQIEILEKYSQGFTRKERLQSLDGAILLGLEDFEGAYESVAKKFGFMRWPDAYRMFGVDPGERHHTQKFLETLARSGRPVIFLIPPNIWSLSYGNNTKRELWWLLENPESLKSVIFVVDAYP